MTEAEFIKEEVYTVRADGGEVRGLRAVSRWEGLTKLEDKDGRFVIVAGLDDGIGAAMQCALGRPITGTMLWGSPELLFDLKTRGAAK